MVVKNVKLSIGTVMVCCALISGQLIKMGYPVGPCLVLCILIEQEGSTPRKSGASMWVDPDGREHESQRHGDKSLQESRL